MKRGAVFLDRDGIINWRIAGGYVRTPAEFHLLPDIVPFLSGVHQLGLLTIVVTNQQGVAKGLMGLEALEAIHKHMQQEFLRLLGFGVDDIFVCIDPAETNSWRRKPQPGMLIEALHKWHLTPEACWMVGDTAADVLAGHRAGIRTILVGAESVPEADFHVRTLDDALAIIVTHQNASLPPPTPPTIPPS